MIQRTRCKSVNTHYEYICERFFFFLKKAMCKLHLTYDEKEAMWKKSFVLIDIAS